ncbi:MAG: hypothetical protein KF700_04165 [Hyphomonadaceae bacterium]|nr:hypothetical protein [Hyphomonadaceae bacterium]
MLRTLLLAAVLALPAGTALAEQFPESALHAEVRADNGVVVGRVEAVERDARGRIVAAEISGQEPASAPAAPDNLIAAQEEARLARVSARAERQNALFVSSQ